MSEAGITIRLVDATEAEQAAFNQPPPNFNEPSASPSSPSSPTATDSPSTSSPTTASPTTAGGSPIPPGQETNALRDSIMALVDRFAPDAFRDPIERLINALTLRGNDRGTQQADTTIAPPISTEQARNIAPVSQVLPTPAREEPQPTTAAPPTAFQRGLARARGAAERIIRRVPGGSRALEVASRASRFTQRAVRAAGRTRVGRSIGRAASSIASRVSPRFAQAVAARGVAAAAASATGAAATGAGTAAAGGAAAAGAAIVPAVGAVVAAFAVAGLAVKTFADTLGNEADRLEEYSGAIMNARLRDQVNTEMNMRDRAGRIGDSLASFEEAKSNINNEMQQIWTEILEYLVTFEPMLSTMTNYAALGLAERRETVAVEDSEQKRIAMVQALANNNPADDKAAISAFVASQNKINDIMDRQRKILDAIEGKATKSNDLSILDAVMAIELDTKGRVIKKK
ncbi:hypothetical protein VN12_11700 [Pirellula sp. SH-Sr6A]|uniref:hypothetical protein n=1 Tax=Pirellula sp. SH-Sr6A TaxID=1632865 RepID=UPI00078DD5EF|nr:hypothetical protein [Pirellula sp. SH-Sr6A]AMV32781.1 hypothetical protein VN12_11700 [Pirellula sp. SH-Sr6A]